MKRRSCRLSQSAGTWVWALEMDSGGLARGWFQGGPLRRDPGRASEGAKAQRGGRSIQWEAASRGEGDTKAVGLQSQAGRGKEMVYQKAQGKGMGWDKRKCA